MLEREKNEFKVGLLGKTSVQGIQCVQHIEVLDPGLNALVLEHNVSAVSCRDVRKSFPQADIVAWYPQGMPNDLEGALDDDFDGIALSEPHLLFVLNAIKKRYFQYRKS